MFDRRWYFTFLFLTALAPDAYAQNFGGNPPMTTSGWNTALSLVFDHRAELRVRPRPEEVHIHCAQLQSNQPAAPVEPTELLPWYRNWRAVLFLGSIALAMGLLIILSALVVVRLWWWATSDESLTCGGEIDRHEGAPRWR